jgi:hypothetical protein
MKRAAAASLALFLALSTACGGADGGNGGSTFAAALRLVPADAARGEDGITVTMTSYRNFYTALDAETPRGSQEWIDIQAHAFRDDRISPATGWGFERSALAPLSENWETAGIDPGAFELVVDYGEPPFRVGIALGTFDPQKLVRSVPSCDGCEADLDRSDHSGVAVLAWGDDPLRVDLRRRLAPPFWDNLGRGGAFAAKKSYLVHAVHRRDIEYVLDAAGRRPNKLAPASQSGTLGGEPVFAAMAAEMDRLNVINAFLTDVLDGQRLEFDPNQPPQADGEPLREYVAIGVGQGLDRDGVFAVIIIAHDKDADAKANVDLLKDRFEQATSVTSSRPWRDIYEVESVFQSGKLVIARVRGQGAVGWLDFYIRQDPLLLLK